MTFVCSAPPVLFPTRQTLAEWIAADTIVFMDTLPFNKRDHFNRFDVLTDYTVTVPIHRAAYWKEVRIDANKQWLTTFRAVFQKNLSHHPYAPVFGDYYLTLLESDDYLTISERISRWILSIIRPDLTLTRQSECPHRFPESLQESDVYLTSDKYHPYLESKHVPHQIVRYNLRSPNGSDIDALSALTSLQLLLEWGPYLPRLFQIEFDV